MIPKGCKRLAEVDLPVAEVSRRSARQIFRQRQTLVSLDDLFLLTFEDRARVEEDAVALHAGDDRRTVLSEQGFELGRAVARMGYGD